MSYTPPEQEIEGPAWDAVNSLRAFRRVIEARLSCSDEWKEDHLQLLRQTEAEVSIMIARILEFAK